MTECPQPTPRRVLVSTTPIPAHTINAAVFVAALTAAGAEVTWHAPRRFHDDIAALGARPVDVHRAWDPDRDSGGIPAMGTLAQVRRGYADHIVGRAAGRAADLLDVMRRGDPDVLLTDTLAYGAGPAAQRARVPWATFGDGPLHDRDPDTPPFGSGLPYRTGLPYRLRNTVVHRVSDVLFAGSAARLRRVRRDLLLPADRTGVLAAGVSPALHLHGGVPGLEYPRRRPLTAGVHFVGSLYLRPRGATPPPWLSQLNQPPELREPTVATGSGGSGGTHRIDGGRRVVALTQGTLRLDTAELIEPVIAALSDQEVDIVVAAGSAAGARRVRRMPSGRARVFAQAYIPFDALMDAASLFITNGGWTGVTAALARGVPVLQVGRTEEKADIGRRVEWSRCGLSIRRSRVTPADIATAVARITSDPAVTAGLSGIHAQFAARDAGATGLALLAELARRKGDLR